MMMTCGMRCSGIRIFNFDKLGKIPATIYPSVGNREKKRKTPQLHTYFVVSRGRHFGGFFHHQQRTVWISQTQITINTSRLYFRVYLLDTLFLFLLYHVLGPKILPKILIFCQIIIEKKKKNNNNSTSNGTWIRKMTKKKKRRKIKLTDEKRKSHSWVPQIEWRTQIMKLSFIEMTSNRNEFNKLIEMNKFVRAKWLFSIWAIVCWTK